MKEVLSLFTFGIWALFFVVFFTALKPDTVAVFARSNKPEYCNRDASPAHRAGSGNLNRTISGISA